MFGALLRIVLVIVIVAAIAAFFVGYRFGDGDRAIETDPVVGTSGSDLDPDIDVDRARETGARVGERIAVAAGNVEGMARAAALSAKIRSKVLLDDTIETTGFDVDTVGDEVTLQGTVESQAQRERLVQLARETEGVATVIDQLVVR
jgi:hypothetical protein